MAVVMMPLSELRLAPTKVGIPVNIDKDETLGVIELMEVLDIVTNFSKNHSKWCQKSTRRAPVAKLGLVPKLGASADSPS